MEDLKLASKYSIYNKEQIERSEIAGCYCLTSAAMAEANILIDSFEKNGQEDVKVQLTIYREHLLLDIRAWRKEDAPFGAGEATKKGISLSIELLPRLKETILKVVKYIRKHTKEITALKEKLDENDLVI